ncbi:quinone oxidoreductase-like protein 1 isoform X2 [Lepisosteus oculatus]|uniref:Crystallin, zeta (quinone reductase)-like 1 n=1 Tax=Lepisosteus oculatus TaxID=7918 RepID=W5MIE4_LEPOC|nr:PREDICTED: quinone oxidoreductase-like protein 1 isoform X2 [Lepisosteus oculatus]
MKGLYCKLSESTAEEVKFVIQETELPSVPGSHFVKVQVKACALSPLDTALLKDLKLQQDLVPVGREIAGVVLEVGPKVTFFRPDDEVVGILPLDAGVSGLCDVVLIHEHHVVHKTEKVSWVEAAGTIRDGLRSYTALHALSHVTAGNTVLVLDGASPFGIITIQLAHYHGAKVLSTALSIEDNQRLEQLRPTVARVISVWDQKSALVDICMEETGGLGVDIVVDTGVRLYGADEESASKKLLPHKHDIITLLAVGGHWVTSGEGLQLDPPDSRGLYLKGATVSFLNDEVWNASASCQGKYLHILKDVVEKLSNKTFRPLLEDPVPLYEATVSMEMVQRRRVRKRQVIQL